MKKMGDLGKSLSNEEIVCKGPKTKESKVLLGIKRKPEKLECRLEKNGWTTLGLGAMLRI